MSLGLTLASVLANIVTKFGNTELTYISDFKSSGTLFWFVRKSHIIYHLQLHFRAKYFVEGTIIFWSTILAVWTACTSEETGGGIPASRLPINHQSVQIFVQIVPLHTSWSFSRPVTLVAQSDKKDILPTWRHHRTIFIWVAGSSISKALKILDDSVLWCEQAGGKQISATNLS